MDNKEFAKKLERRTREFTVRIIRLSSELPNTPEGRVIRYQLTKAGSSIGANYREANRPRSHAEFQSKIGICRSEAGECEYWLEVIMDLDWIARDRVMPEYEECGELLAIFTSINKR
jgi:four helix bundle protein